MYQHYAFCRESGMGSSPQENGLFGSRLLKLVEDPVKLFGQREIFFSESASIMRGKRQLHLVVADIQVRMVVELLSLFGDAIDEVKAVQEVLKLESSENSPGTFRPFRDGFQAPVDFFGGQGSHIFL